MDKKAHTDYKVEEFESALKKDQLNIYFQDKERKVKENYKLIKNHISDTTRGITANDVLLPPLDQNKIIPLNLEGEDEKFEKENNHVNLGIDIKNKTFSQHFKADGKNCIASQIHIPPKNNRDANGSVMMGDDLISLFCLQKNGEPKELYIERRGVHFTDEKQNTRYNLNEVFQISVEKSNLNNDDSIIPYRDAIFNFINKIDKDNAVRKTIRFEKEEKMKRKNETQKGGR